MKYALIKSTYTKDRKLTLFFFIFKHFKHNKLNIRFNSLTWLGWYIGIGNSIYPKWPEQELMYRVLHFPFGQRNGNCIKLKTLELYLPTKDEKHKNEDYAAHLHSFQLPLCHKIHIFHVQAEGQDRGSKAD